MYVMVWVWNGAKENEELCWVVDAGCVLGCDAARELKQKEEKSSSL